MTNTPHNQINGDGRDDRSLELAAAFALGALEDHEERELHEVFGDDADEIVREFELAAAALTTALPVAASDAMPDAVRQRLTAAGAQWARSQRTASSSHEAPDSLPFRQSAPSPRRASWVVWGGWVAAAACLAVAAAGWWSGSGRWSTAPADDRGSLAGASQETLADLRSRMIYWGVADSGDAVLASWTPTDDPDATALAAGGDIVWSTERQSGYMRIEGLAANDPASYQYQLWIFDEDQKHPVDGGVFDVPANASGGEVLIPVDPKITVRKPTLFAVTVERPGGVVVSDRERIALLAPELKPVGQCFPELKASRGNRRG